MNKEVRITAVVLILFLVLAVPVYAIGQSGGGSRAGENDRDSDGNGEDERKINCEESDIRRERIKCRIANRGNFVEPEGTLPEACRGVNDRQGCQGLYRSVRVCYGIDDGREKNRCFMRAAGFDKIRVGDETTDRAPKARRYLIALLYDLEERIEYANEEGRLSDDEAAMLIDKVIEIKQNILNDVGKEEIRKEMRELRGIWRPNIDE
jgi:hypothetical protein